MKEKYNIVDLFCGAGGFSQGFLKAGYKIKAASEIWNPAVESYKFNHEKVRIIEGDISLSEVKQELYDAVKDSKIHMVIGGPPCQGYSIAGNRNPDDPRGQLYLDFVEIINTLKPDFFVMENVKGLLHMKHVDPNLKNRELKLFKDNCKRLQRFKDLKRFKAQRELGLEENQEFSKLKNNLKMIKKGVDSNLIPLKDKILQKFKEINYKVSWKVLNSADHGVPQTRERIFFFGTKHEEIEINFPKKTHSKNSEYGSLESHALEDTNDRKKNWITAKQCLQKYENWSEKAEKNHLFTKHSDKFKIKLKNTSIGTNVYENYSDAWWRLDPEKPARTVKENHGGVFVHYKHDRACTPRELAALQSFDDDYIFKGTKSSILKQIGNAVPPLMSKAIAEQIKLHLNEIYVKK